MINMTAFSPVVRNIRNEMHVWDREEESIYSFYRWFVRNAADDGKFAPAEEVTEHSIYRGLLRAAAAKGSMGATDAQCRYLASLMFAAGDHGTPNTLRESEASSIIDFYRTHPNGKF